MKKLIFNLMESILASRANRVVEAKRSREYFDFDAFLEFLLEARGTLRFVQIGGCDGVSYDPIYDFVIRNKGSVGGIVVEPLPEPFKSLENNYAHCPKVTLVNYAIHNTESEMPIYRVDPARLSELPHWAIGISSFNKDHHELSGTPSEYIIEQNVPCKSLSELLDEHAIDHLDLLQIDTEGYDREIVRGIDFGRIRPTIIRFEHRIADQMMTREQFGELASLLHEQGYELIVERHDATAYLPEMMLPSAQ